MRLTHGSLVFFCVFLFSLRLLLWWLKSLAGFVTLVDSPMVSHGQSPSGTFPSRVWTFSLEPCGLWADLEPPSHAVQTDPAPALLLAFHLHCSEIIASLNRSGELPGKYLSAHWCSWGTLWARLRPLPVAGSSPQGPDSCTKQLGSVVTPSELPHQLGKSLQLTPTQLLSFTSSHSPVLPESSLCRSLALGTFPENSADWRHALLLPLPRKRIVKFPLRNCHWKWVGWKKCVKSH